MKPKLQVCLLAGALPLCLAKAAASPVTGAWEGEDGGVKAVTLNIRESGGKIRVDAVFYIVHDEGSGKHAGEASEAPSATGTWDGHKLQFTIVNTAGESVPFEMTMAGGDRAELKRPAAHGMPETTIALRRK
jgi:hypothetical protein